MTKKVIIYKSTYGSTKKYAQWIANALNCDLFEISNIKIENLSSYDVIIYGGGIYAGNINGLSVLTKKFETIKQKNIIIFTVGLNNINNIYGQIKDINFTKEMQDTIKFYPFYGSINHNKLNFVHKSMLFAMKSILKKKDKNTLTEEERNFFDICNNNNDFCDEISVNELVGYVNTLN